MRNLIASTAGRTVRLACEATGELNFKVFISRLIPRDFAVKWHATEIWKTLSTLSSTSSSSHRPNGQSPNNTCRIQYACFWSSSAKNKKANLIRFFKRNLELLLATMRTMKNPVMQLNVGFQRLNKLNWKGGGQTTAAAETRNK
ncbi:hypothetical protein T07_3164 [Trichinella nelsoni]|uniref:Uncharacterized protein n=1 Tax=Trichinella nelsoni TaxID=6336 RepID=A0A0V0SLB6_9BILA|nr:hypothetical protein T07_3164 [Trichinella nelsoni]